MTDKQPEALRLAKIIDEGSKNAYGRQAAAELRRLHEVNMELVEALRTAKHAMSMRNWNWNSVASDDFQRETYKTIEAAIAKVQGDNND